MLIKLQTKKERNLDTFRSVVFLSVAFEFMVFIKFLHTQKQAYTYNWCKEVVGVVKESKELIQKELLSPNTMFNLLIIIWMWLYKPNEI